MKRRPLLLSLLLAGMVLAAALAIFFLTFDLNRYRSQIETALSSALKQPVQLGQANLSLRHGPAIAFTDVRTEFSGEIAGTLTVNRLFLKLETIPLLGRRLVFSEVLLDRPEVVLTRKPLAVSGDTTPAPAPVTSQPFVLPVLLEETRVRSLRWKDGSVRWTEASGADQAFTLAAENVHGGLTDFRWEEGGTFEAAGDLSLDDLETAISLTGTLGPTVSPASGWQSRRARFDLDLDHFDPAPWLNRFFNSPPFTTSGEMSLKLSSSGSWKEGWQISGQILSPGLEAKFPGLSGRSPAVQEFSVQGSWHPDKASLALDHFALKTEAGSAEGRISLEGRQEGHWLRGDLASSAIDLSRTRSLWQEKLAEAFPVRGLKGGSLRVDRLLFDGPLSAWRGPPSSWPLEEGALKVKGLGISLTRDLVLSDLAANLDWNKGRLKILDGSGRILDGPLTFSGNLHLPPEGPVAVELQAKGTWEAERLMALVPKEKSGKLTAAGPFPVKGEMKGTLEKLLIDVQSDLTGLALSLPNLLEKPAGRPASLFGAISVTDGQVELGHGRLQIEDLEVRGQGFHNFAGSRDFGFDLDVEKVDVAAIDDLLPPLKKLHQEGALSLHYHLEGQEGRVQKQDGTISLHQTGFHIVGVIADLNQASGEIRIHPDHAEIANLTARLGESPATISGRISNYSDPVIEVSVSVPRLRAKDLYFFRPEERVLENVVGRLVIDRRRIEFAPVTLSMERGTSLSVTGRVEYHDDPRVLLDIEAEHANLDEVVGLWRGPGPPAPQPGPGTAQTKKRPVTVSINAKIKEGTLGGLGSMGDLTFKDLEANIGYHDGLLTIYPLHFHSGPGFFVGEVAVDNRRGSPSLFKISGHLDQFDAATLHHDLLRRRGVITGSLTGDFYLQGYLGGRFAETSQGGFDMDVQEGVLRKFQFLSKVFSLLNVSQILTLQLPDMAVEGMPFDRLSGSFRLVDGLLSTEDLFVESNAMNLSLVGEFNVVNSNLDAVLGVKPLRTVDRIITKIPIAGWILAGEEKAVVTAHFQIRGPAEDPDVYPLPINSISGKVLGIFRRILGLPGKMVTDLENLAGPEEKPGDEKQEEPKTEPPKDSETGK